MAFQVVLLIATEIAGFFYQQSYEEQLMDTGVFVSNKAKSRISKQVRRKQNTLNFLKKRT